MLPLPLQDTSMFMEVDVNTWRGLLDANGEASRLTERPFTHQELLTSLLGSEIAPEFNAVLEVIQELGTDDGRAHIEQIAIDHVVALPASPVDTPTREFVALLLLQSKTNQKIKDLIEIAQLTLRSVSSARTYREYVGQTNPAGTALDPEKLKVEIEKWCREHQKNDVVTVNSHYHNGDWYCHVVRGDSVRRVMEIKDRSVSRLEYRPATTDLLRYDPKTGRIGIATRYGQMAQGYRAVLGSFLAGDAQFFGGENICSLKKLQQYQAALFAEDRLPRGMRRVGAVELLWRRGERDRVSVRGRDCFKILRDLEAKLQEGEIVEAKLSMSFATGGRAGHVTIKVPNIIDIKAPGQEALVEQFLDSVGIRGAFNDDGTPRTFWGLFPWRLKEAEWRRRLGSSFDDLVGRKVLRPISLSAVAHPDHPAVSHALEVEETDGGTMVGVGEDQGIGIRLLTSSDTEGYELEVSHLVQAIQKSLGLEGVGRELDNGLWALGQRTFQAGSVIAVFLCLRQPASTVAATVDVEARGRGTAVVLYPECGFGPLSSGANVSCRLPHGPYDDVLERIISQLGWTSTVPANLWSSAHLILDSVRGVAWYRSIELTELPANSQPFKFALRVARANGALVTKQVLNDMLSPSRDEGARQAKLAFVKAAKASFQKQGLAIPEELAKIFATRTNGYALEASALVLDGVR